MLNIALIAKALVEYRKVEGSRWKNKLRADWSEGEYFYCHRDYENYLRQMRNYFFDVLDKIKSNATQDEIEAVLCKVHAVDTGGQS